MSKDTLGVILFYISLVLALLIGLTSNGLPDIGPMNMNNLLPFLFMK